MNNVDYGLIALFGLQTFILMGVAWLFARLTNKLERIKEAEMAFKHLSQTLDEKVEKLGKSYDAHKAKVKEMLSEKLDYQVADDKLRSELRSLNSRFSMFKKKVEDEVPEDVDPEIQPGSLEQLSNGEAPPAEKQIQFPGFGATM